MKRILIVEDDEYMQEMYGYMFDNHRDKYEIKIEGDAEEALKKLEGKGFDLIILDIIMEPMTGDTFFMNARQEKGIDTPVLVVSVLKQNVLENLKDMENVSFLQKPITEDQLINKIDKILADK